MKNYILLPMVTTLVTLCVSCGNDMASGSYRNAKASIYDVADANDNSTDYVAGTYSANRVKYYDGMYNDGSSYLYDYNAANNARNYSNTVKNTTTKDYSISNTKDSNYMNNSYMNTNPKYDNAMYKNMSEVDFNNGLLTYDDNYANYEMNSATDKVNTNYLTTNALNSYGYDNGNTQITTTTNKENNYEVNDMSKNKMSYEMNNTYSEIKDATKDMVQEVTKDTKEMMNTAKAKTKKALNMPK